MNKSDPLEELQKKLQRAGLDSRIADEYIIIGEHACLRIDYGKKALLNNDDYYLNKGFNVVIIRLNGKVISPKTVKEILGKVINLKGQGGRIWNIV